MTGSALALSANRQLSGQLFCCAELKNVYFRGVMGCELSWQTSGDQVVNKTHQLKVNYDFIFLWGYQL